MNCYDYVGFNRTEIEQLLQINLRDSDEEYQNILKDKLPEWLTPFLSRINITIKETAALIVGVIPYSIQTDDIGMVIINYEKSLWDAVDCNLLSCRDISYTNANKDIRHDGYLLRAEVKGWLKANGFHWPLPPTPYKADWDDYRQQAGTGQARNSFYYGLYQPPPISPCGQ